MESNEDLSSSNDQEKDRKPSLRPRKPEKVAEDKVVEDKVKKQKEKNRLKVKAWRNRQKTENPTNYDALKKADEDRKKKERIKVKQMANSDPELKALLRKKDMSQERKENILAKLENPLLVNERGHSKFKTDELHAINVDVMKIHNHTCFK